MPVVDPEFKRQVDETIRKMERLNRAFSGHNVANVLLRAMLIPVARAKEIITAKGHVVTGTLRRSIHAVIVDATEEEAKGQYGSFVHYAEHVEMLPDGGYLFEASERTWPEVKDYIGVEMKKIIQEEAR